MRGSLALAATVSVAVGTACAGSSTAETSVRDAFIDCMADEGITVEDVEVGIADGRHVGSFDWDVMDGEAPEEVGQRCEDAALGQFQVSRT